ncbi:MAG: hypothetical protein U9Q20_08470 [Campylobacterota bacterium]|nr:hypothetical protein [Campylobacterota bacterium]
MKRYNHIRIRVIISIIVLITALYQFKDIILSDFKIILFILLLGVIFAIIYYFSVTIFDKNTDKFDRGL